MWTRIAALFYLAALAAAASCPDGFDDLGLNSNLCYKFVTSENVTWTSAFTSCLTASASVVSIFGSEDFYALSFAVRQGGQDVWTGLIDVGGTKSWADNTPYNTDLDAFFSSDPGAGIYGFLSAEDGLLHVGDGRQPRGYVCYVDVTPATTTAEPTSTTPASTTPKLPACDTDDGWVQYNTTCFLLSSDVQYWAAAAHGCHELDAEPVSVHDHGVLFFLLLQSQQAGAAYWIGLQDHNGTYVYEDGSSTDDVDAIVGPYMDVWSEDNNCIALDASKYPRAARHRSCFTELQYSCYKPARPGAAPFYPQLDEEMLLVNDQQQLL